MNKDGFLGFEIKKSEKQTLVEKNEFTKTYNCDFFCVVKYVSC
jgi:hypothetical protein